jgi:hypothetical protein
MMDTAADPVTVVILRHRTEPTKQGPKYRTAYAAKTLPSDLADRIYIDILTDPQRRYEAEVHPSSDLAGTVEHIRYVYGRNRTYRMAWPIEGEWDHATDPD